MRLFAAGCMALCAFLAGCGGSSNITDSVNVATVEFPNGTKISAETMRDDIDLIRGLMFRESMPADHGMLFFHPTEDIYHYWMYQTKIPLDIIWMDHNRKIVEMSADTPPCKSSHAQECPNYGGHEKSQMVLEVNAGIAAKNGLRVGDTLQF